MVELVIKIPENQYRNICSGDFDMDGYFKRNLRDVFESGTVLKKDHGRLKDADAIKQEVLCHEYSNDFCKDHHIDHSINTEIALAIIDNASTLLEADKGEQG